MSELLMNFESEPGSPMANQMKVLQDQNQQIMNQGLALENERNQLLNQLRLLQLEKDTLLLQTQLKDVSQRPNAPSSKRPIWPEKHDGNKNGTRGFINAFKNCLSLIPDTTEHEKISYFGALLKGPALNWFSPYVERPQDFPAVLESFETFVWNFERNFGIINRDKVAFDQLKVLKQGRQPASVYAASFRSLVIDVDWNETTKIQHFRDGLNVEVKKLLLSRPKQLTLEDLVADAVELDQEFQQLCREEVKPQRQRPFPVFPAVANYEPPVFQPRPATANLPVPMDLDNIRRGPLTPQEREHRMRLGLCLYCGDKGHLRVDCKQANRRHRQVSHIQEHRPQEDYTRELANIDFGPVKDNLSCLADEPSYNRLMIDGVINYGIMKRVAIALVDSGSEDCFVDQDFANRLQIPLVPLKQPIVLSLADGLTPIGGGLVEFETIPLQLHMNEHIETISLKVTKLHHNIIIGFNWLALHNPHINWTERRIRFNSEYCLTNCTSKVMEVKNTSNDNVPNPIVNEIKSEQAAKNTKKVIFNDDLEIRVIPPRDEPMNDYDLIDQFVRDNPDLYERQINYELTNQEIDMLNVDPYQKLSISEISLPALDHYRSDPDSVIIPGFVTMDENDNMIYKSITSITKDVYPFFEGASENSETILPDELQDFKDVFEKKSIDDLPPHRDYDATIDLESDAKPCFGKLYSMTQEEDKVMQEWIAKSLSKNWIRKSTSPFGAPCFFVRKSDWKGDKKLRLCMDYRALNKQTIKNRNPLPLISDMMRTLAKGKVFTTLDLEDAYQRIRIKEGHEAKTAFITKYGLFEFLVLPFGLANAPAQFQTMMSDLFKDRKNFVLVYLDDIVVFSENPDDHWDQVKQVLQVLRENKLFCKLSKCHFKKKELAYLGYVLSDQGISMDPRKVEAIKSWPVPKDVHGVQMFLGFANFYRKLIPSFAELTVPITRLLKKDNKFEWGKEQQQAFESIRDAFCSPAVLEHPDEEKAFVVECDASKFAIAGVLSQNDEYGILRPVAYYSRQLTSPEMNYEIYDRELLAVHECFKEWRHFLQGGRFQVTVLTDHENLKWFMTTKKLSPRQARWAVFFSGFDFILTHRPGSRNGKADLLSRREDYDVHDDNHNMIQLLKPEQFVNVSGISTTSICSSDWILFSVNAIRCDSLNMDVDEQLDWPLLIGDFLATNEWRSQISAAMLEHLKQELKHFKFREGVLMRILNDSRTTVPYLPAKDRDVNLKRFHEGLGHLRFDSIYDLIARRYWWPDMKNEIKKYIVECPKCQLDQPTGSVHAAPPSRPIPPVALPFER
jgi:hypothetical protein